MKLFCPSCFLPPKWGPEHQTYAMQVKTNVTRHAAYQANCKIHQNIQIQYDDTSQQVEKSLKHPNTPWQKYTNTIQDLILQTSKKNRHGTYAHGFVLAAGVLLLIQFRGVAKCQEVGRLLKENLPWQKFGKVVGFRLSQRLRSLYTWLIFFSFSVDL